MSHAQRIDRTNPGCIVFLVDQSYSMNEPISGGDGESKAVALAGALNDLLYELVIRCVKDPKEGPRHYYDVAVLGYGLQVGPVWGGALEGRDLVAIPDVARNPIRVEEVGAGPDRSTTGAVRKRPVWFDPTADGATPMSEAMNRTGALVAEWIKQHPSSFPPIVINITDGAASDGDPAEWARRLRSLKTEDGNLLLFNLNLSALPGEQVWFPNTAAGLDDEFARPLFEMSSELPGFMAEVAGSKGHAVGSGARGFVFNADFNALVSFLQVGTATYHVSRHA